MVTASEETDTGTPEVMEPALSSNQRLAQEKSGVNIVPEISAEDVQRSKQAKHYGNRSGLVRDDNLDKMHTTPSMPIC